MTEIFVFGSNLRGHHGMGAALMARRLHGAVYGQGEGFQGRSYAIPTKGWNMEVLSLKDINQRVQDFIRFAREHPDMKFLLTRVGCGLAGFKDEQMAPLFQEVPSNVVVPKEWRTHIQVFQAFLGVDQAPG